MQNINVVHVKQITLLFSLYKSLIYCIERQQRKTRRVEGEEQRAGIRETGSETRTTDLQREMFRRYKENRDFEQAQDQYRT